MEESGISRAVVMGRKADEYGEVDNEDILELARAYPQTFIPFAGLNPYDADLPDRVDALARQGFRGFRGAKKAGRTDTPSFPQQPVSLAGVTPCSAFAAAAPPRRPR